MVYTVSEKFAFRFGNCLIKYFDDIYQFLFKKKYPNTNKKLNSQSCNLGSVLIYPKP